MAGRKKVGRLQIKIDELVAKHDIEWRWVKGHAGDFGNEKADELANKGVPVKGDK